MNTTLNRQTIQDIYPLSPMQQGMLFHSLYAPNSGAYVIQVSYELHGSLNIPAFEEAWQYLVNRHTVLRTAFVWNKLEKPLQVVGKQLKCPITYLDWRNYSTTAQQQELAKILQKEREQGFSLSQAPLMHITLIQLAPAVYQFVWSYHHLLLDGWSMPILLQEFLMIYGAYIQGQTPRLSNPRPYRDYIAWLQQQNVSQAEAFWKQHLQGFTTPTRLGIGQLGETRPDNLSTHYTEQSIHLTCEQTQQLQSFAKQQQITLNTLVQAAFALLLSRYSGEIDILFGTVCSGRPGTLTGVESMVGLFVNTLPLRVSVSPQQKLYSWLQNIQLQQVEIRQYEYSNLTDIQRCSEVPRSLPLFETLVVFENYPVESALKQSLETLQIRNIHATEQTNYPLTLYAVADSQLSLRILSDRDRYTEDNITQLLQQLETLLLGMLTQGDCLLVQLPLLSPIQQQQILVDWNNTAREIPNQCLDELFAQQVKETPDATAVVFEEHSLSYAELNAKANQMANYLQKLGIQPEARIGVYLERSPQLLIALLGILKTGAAYIPLDPSYPAERLRFMIEDAEIALLVTESSLEEDAGNYFLPNYEIICIDTDWSAIAQQIIKNPECQVNLANLAYLIYTSGSTGKPKGVMVEMRSLVNILTALKQQLSITASDRLLASTTIAFDIAALELFLPIIAGAQLILTRQTALVDPSQLTAAIKQHEVTVMQATPATWRLLLASGWRGKEDLKILCGGEALDNSLAQELISCSGEVWNLYGPTETTIWSAVQQLSLCESVTIGRPITNTQFYVLDDYLQPVPVGLPGELYIGGAGVARGYWQRPELTAERFVANPFTPPPTPPPFDKLRASLAKGRGAREGGGLSINSIVSGLSLYKTGDRVRYLADGNLEYLGRLDNQVKIRGYRIELGEIEAVLNQHPEVAQAVVAVQEDEPGERRLVAYVVYNTPHPSPPLAKGRELEPIPNGRVRVSADGVTMRSFLATKLPVYMIPAVFIVLEQLPLTPNGKVNRQALPAPNNSLSRLATSLILPQTQIEQKIAEIWQELLHIDTIGIDDNFFDLGGHSLLMVRMQGQLRDRIHQDIPLVELFRYSTISSLSTYLAQTTASTLLDGEVESRIVQLETGKQRLLQRRQQLVENQQTKPN
ncbi:amino acid adenylation domain-containing protein [Nostoc edaphicum CCNP1411]|uniref:Amino acid adenylation domain-containing protein n=1 Tax=Nostoc edaphicum CCNP1411 TaxID=1472755 RepID=A0A7D7LLC1_9NOSO|nr:non-ribosomal peptide synthetase [Nostoc edaphicum]QMS92207.1 amino acid adenylation domain-containing protein [Nostoc edaphicum CCNP1411]